jgi:hypothetical protein
VQYSYVGAIIAYLLTEGAVGTDGGHFKSIDCSLKEEAALILTRLHGSYVSKI